MNCPLIGRIRTRTFLATLAVMSTTAITLAQDAPSGNGESDPKVETVDLATQHAAKVNAALLAARRYERDGQWRQAAAKYSEALQLMPTNEQASRGYQQAMALLEDGSSLAQVDQGVRSVEQRYQEQRSLAIIEFDEGVSRAQQLMAAEDFAAADRAILTAQIKLRQRKQYLSQIELSEMNERAEHLISIIGEARVNARLLADQAATEEAEASRLSETTRAETLLARLFASGLASTSDRHSSNSQRVRTNGIIKVTLGDCSRTRASASSSRASSRACWASSVQCSRNTLT